MLRWKLTSCMAEQCVDILFQRRLCREGVPSVQRFTHILSNTWSDSCQMEFITPTWNHRWVLPIQFNIGSKFLSWLQREWLMHKGFFWFFFSFSYNINGSTSGWSRILTNFSSGAEPSYVIIDWLIGLVAERLRKEELVQVLDYSW